MQKYRKAAFSLFCAFGLLPAIGVPQPAPAETAGEVNLLVNGGFEHTWRVAPPVLEAFLENARQHGPRYEGEDPLLPLRWQWSFDRQSLFRLAPEHRTAGYAVHVRTSARPGRLFMRAIEVVPGGRYAFGAWTRGTGRGRVTVYGLAVEGRREMVTVEMEGAAEWAEASGELKIPGHIRQIELEIVLDGESDLRIDDVFFSAALATPADPGAVLSQPLTRDEHTLLRVNFDEDEGNGYFLNSQAHLTDEGFSGRGVRLSRDTADNIEIPIDFDWPDEGTLEFRAALDERATDGMIHHLLELDAGNMNVAGIQSDTSEQVQLRWRIDNQPWGPTHGIGANRSISKDMMRMGQWMHLAMSWDREATRFYVNGMLVDTSIAQPQPFYSTPTVLRLGSRYSVRTCSGVVDEIRVSNVQRYGPFVPAGTDWTPLTRPTAVPVEESVPIEADVLPDFAEERKALLAPLPEPPAGTVVFEADRMRALLEDDEGFNIKADRPAPGLTTAQVGHPSQLLGSRHQTGGYWRLDDLAPGGYYLGIWYQSGRAGIAEVPGDQRSGPLVFLNGRVVQFSTTSDPVQVAEGVYFAEAQSKERVSLQPGDELAVLHRSGARGQIIVGRLILYPKEPERGRGWLSIHYESNYFLRGTALGIFMESAFLAAEGRTMRNPHNVYRMEQETNSPADLRMTADGTQALAQCRIANPLPVPVTVAFEARIQGYFREVVGSDRAVITLQPHEAVTRHIPYTVLPDSPRYTITADARVIDPPDLGWPDDTVRFFPGYLQDLPFPDPFTAREERSLRFSGMLEGQRRQMRLGGAWDSAFSYELEPPVPAPDDLEWNLGEARIPFRYHACPTAQVRPRPRGLYLRRTFELPENGGTGSYRLAIENVTDEATVYINGVKVGNVRGSSAPLVCDITRAARPGENEIILVVRGILALMNPDYINPDNPVPNRDYLNAPGLFSNRGASGEEGGFGVGEVVLDLLPPVSGRDLQILPSVRRGELTARVTVSNYSETSANLRIVARVQDAGEPVLDLPGLELSLAPGESARPEFVHAWSDPELWGPGNPKLYTLAVEILDRESGQRLDLYRERFGFRESWIADGRVYFNGRPVRMKGSTVQGGKGVGGDDVQISRGSEWPHFMDEFGYLLTFNLGGISNTSSRHNVDSDPFWETAQRNILNGILYYANHPSIIAWDLSNEWLSFLDYSGADPLKGARRFHTLAQAVQGNDPKRWVMFNGDGNLRGLHDVSSTHYLLEGRYPHPIAGYGFHGRSSYFPDGAFFRPLDEQFYTGQEVVISGRRGTTTRYGMDVLMNTENIWKVGHYMPPGPSKFLGDEDVVSPAFDSGRGPALWKWKLNIDGHRDLGVAKMANYTARTGLARRGHMLQCFIMPDHTRRYFADETIHRDYSLHNDLFEPQEYLLRWTLVDPDGRTVAEGEDARRMDSGDLQRGSFELELPRVEARTHYTLRLRLYAEGQFAYGETRPVEVWPAEPAASVLGARPLHLYDPSGDTAVVLERLGVAFTRLEALAVPETPDTVLVIGAGAVSAAADAGALEAYVQSGGRVLVLEQERLLPGLPVRMNLETREWSSLTFLRTPQHPVLAGLADEDLLFWTPDHVVSRGAYAKPAGGPAIALIDSGTAEGVEWTQLMELYQGRGLYLLSQLPLVDKFDREPMARELLRRALTYLTGEEAFRSPRRVLQVVARPGSPVLEKLQEAGVAHKVIQPGAALEEGAALLVEAAGIDAAFSLPDGWLAGALERGADVILHGATPEHQTLLSTLAGAPVTVTVQPYRMWEGRAYRNGFTELTPGLSHIDLYWKRYEKTEGAGSQAEDPRNKIEDAIMWSVSAEHAREHIFPGGLVEMPAAAGRLIVSQVRWHTGHGDLERSSARVLASLALGLDVRIAPYRPPRELPDRVAYRTINLAPFSNRGFIDEVAGDGKGGWSDQGPDMDLRGFPTGRQGFGRVPFDIGEEPHTCIVLRSTHRPHPELQPAEVTIPVGYPVEGFWFLHGSTYTSSDLVGLYQVQYSDGTVQDIPLVLGENIRDWISDSGPFPRERHTRSRVAWTGTTKIFPVVAVYQMLWVNPHPEKTVQSVRFANPVGIACPILIALTAVVGEDFAEPEVTEDVARKEALHLQAREQFAAGEHAQALELLDAVLDLDFAYEPAHQLRGEIMDRMHDVDGALEAYRRWTEAGARTPLPYNRIGEILEQREDYRGALEAYERSLEIEWNQPPIITSRRRLSELLGR